MNTTERNSDSGMLSGMQPDFSPSVKMLIGSYERKLDSKLRIGLPQQFRDKLSDMPLIMVRWLKRSLAIFPQSNWLPYAEAISRLDLYTDVGLTVRHQMFAHAREISMDKEGRIVLPPDMVKYAGLDRKIMVLGDWDKVTIWASNYYEHQVELDDVTVTERFPQVLQMAKGQKSVESFVNELKGQEQKGDGD